MSEEKKKEPARISRREFLKDAGIVVGGTAVGSSFLLTACGGGEEVTKTVTTTTTAPGSTITTTAAGGTATLTQTVNKYVCPIDGQEFSTLDALQDHFRTAHPEAPESNLGIVTYHVNGHQHTIQVDPHETLHDVLREKCGYLSLKDMCTGWGACGSCTVLVEGRPILSCMALAAEFDGAEMETAEGLAEKKHPLIESYVKNYAMQCGYCTPGFIVTAKALLDHNSDPTEADIRDALGGNLCRCGTYPRHIPAVQEAAANLQGGGA